MKALVTGASSGIGKEIAIYLDKLGYEVISNKIIDIIDEKIIKK